MNTFKSICLSIVAASFLALSAQAVAAQDATAVADFLVKIAERAGGTDTKFGSAVKDGNDVVITDFYTRMTKDKDDFDIGVATMRIQEPAWDADGGLSASTITTGGIAMSSGKAHITIGEIETSDVRYPSPTLEEAEFLARSKSAYSALEARDINIATEQNAEVPIARVAITNDEIIDGIAHKISFVAEGIVVDPQLASDAEARRKSKELGYDKLSLNAAVDARWDEQAGMLHLERIQFGGDDVGSLTMTASIGGITRELALAQDQEEASKHWQNITLTAATFNFVNDSIIERVIAQQAADEGIPPEEMINATIVQLPDMMAFLGSPDLAARATEALSTFLKSPQSLHVEARPASAIPVVQIIGMAMMAPAAALEMLNLDITANR